MRRRYFPTMAFKQLNLKQGLIFSALYLCGLIAILFGFFIPTHETMNLWFRSCGLTIVSGTAVIWIYSLIQVLCKRRDKTGTGVGVKPVRLG